jgi:hypothetical protein
MTQVEIKNNTVLRVIKTDTILCDYVLMPIEDLSQHFLYRFVEPMVTCWRSSKVPLYDVMGTGGNLNDTLRRTAMKHWYTLMDDIPGDWPEEAMWLKQMSKIMLRECHIVPRE